MHYSWTAGSCVPVGLPSHYGSPGAPTAREARRDTSSTAGASDLRRDSEQHGRESATPRTSEENLESPQVRAERESLEERIHGWLDLPLAILALIWTILVVVELAVPLSPLASEQIAKVNFAIWFVFAVVFFFEFALAPNKLRYLQHNFLSALAVGLPFFRVVRVLQFGRVLRSTSLVRLIVVANRATAGAAEIFREQQFAYVVSLVLVSTLLSAAGVFFFERGVPGTPFQTFWEALWWAAALATTINIGADPVTLEGRVIALLQRVVALAVFGYVTASIASFLVGQRVNERPKAPDDPEAILRLTEEVRQLRATIEQLDRPHPPAPPSDRQREDTP